MKKRHVSILGAALLLWNCNLPLESWYDEMRGEDQAAATRDPLPASNPSGEPGTDPDDPPAELPDPGPADEIDVRKVHWNDFNVGNWPVEDTPFGVSVDGKHIRWTFDQSGWPARNNVNGNIFLIWKENGRYYGESFEHIRPHAKQISAHEAKGGGKLRSKPDSWRPVKGRTYGLVLTSHVRGWSDARRRTNIEVVTWK